MCTFLRSRGTLLRGTYSITACLAHPGLAFFDMASDTSISIQQILVSLNSVERSDVLANVMSVSKLAAYSWPWLAFFGDKHSR